MLANGRWDLIWRLKIKDNFKEVSLSEQGFLRTPNCVIILVTKSLAIVLPPFKWAIPLC